jgi:uncharacterized damage-inducible protein DinB
MQELINSVMELAVAERSRACAKYGSAYHSDNEVQGVLTQEVSEVEAEFNSIARLMFDLHDAIHHKRDISKTVDAMEQAALSAAAEAIQVAAVCQKSRSKRLESIAVKTPQRHDPVNSPAHYMTGGVETIDFIEAKGFNYHRGQVCKYLTRAGLKDPETEIQDLEKAAYYLSREISNLKSQRNGQ